MEPREVKSNSNREAWCNTIRVSEGMMVDLFLSFPPNFKHVSKHELCDKDGTDAEQPSSGLLMNIEINWPDGVIRDTRNTEAK